MQRIIHGDNQEVLPTLPDAFARLIYIDPPFNTGTVQKRTRIKVQAATGANSSDRKGSDRDGGDGNGGDRTGGDRTGFGGRRYVSQVHGSPAFADRFDDFTAFLMPRIEAALRCLTPDGSLFVHLDAREVHYIKVALDQLLGRACFMNEIIWAYDFGGRSKRKWPAKHDTILWYALDPERYVFHYDAIDRIPYLAPGLVGREKAARGKTPTDVWWQTIVPTGGREKTGYPTQKPRAILDRIVRVHTDPGDTILDFFAGSGTTGEAAAANGRGYLLIDSSEDAAEVMSRRLEVGYERYERYERSDEVTK